MNTNIVVISGNLTRDPELRYTGTGKAVCEFGVAVNTGWGERQETYWAQVVCWEKTAEYVNANYAKGSGVLVTGRLKLEEWTDRQSGRRRNATRIVAANVEHHDAAAQQDSRPPQSCRGPYSARDVPPEKPEEPEEAAEAQGGIDDDVPF